MAEPTGKSEFATARETLGVSRGAIRRFFLALLFLLAFVVVSILGYAMIEPNYSLFDSIYMTVITIFGVGYDETHPLSMAGRIWTILVIFGGVGLGAVAVGLFVAVVLEGEIRNIVGRRQLEKDIARLSEHVIVCGYGMMGALIAEELLERTRDVVVIDTKPERTAAAERAGLLFVLGDAQEEKTLTAAGIERASVLVATLKDDADNVFVTLTARQANSRLKIVARAQQSATEAILRRAGATRVVCPQIIGASRVVDVVTRPAVVDLVEMAHKGVELEMDQLVLTTKSNLVGKTLLELALPKKTGATVVAIQRADGTPIYQPTSDMVLKAGDTLVLVGKKGAARQVQQLDPDVGQHHE
ncbi:MAG: potassium channel family protein [Phycisphaerae bacterium]